MNFGNLFQEAASIKLTDRAPLVTSSVPLSEEQALALAAPINKSAIIRAGAGAGKTMLMTQRAKLLIKKGAKPSRVAVVTFTRKAAAEIKHRLTQSLGNEALLPVCSTVHALALSVLRKANQEISVASDGQLLQVIKDLSEFLPSEAEDLKPAEVLLEVNRIREESCFIGPMGIFARMFERQLENLGLTDFTALITQAIPLASNSFDYVLVDEAQDLSALQRSFLKAMSGKNTFYWYIGDSDQAIYVFRGAHASVMDELAKECELEYVLSTNFRSAQKVVTHANNVIQNNPGRPAIQWRANRADEGDVLVQVFEHGDNELEAVKEWLTQGSNRAVLGRTQRSVSELKDMGLPAFTVHESKGLEWADVWIIGCEAALFPHPLSSVDEERRLFYVAMTRAKESLRMSYCNSRAQKKGPVVRHPSRFLFETQALAG